MRCMLVASSQHGESCQSFLAAASAGASFVEFDVQVTRDGVPVIWHDDTIQFGNPSNPNSKATADITLEEIKSLSNATTNPTAADSSDKSVVRSFWDLATFKRTPVQPWQCGVDDSFPTLEEVFHAIHPTVGFDIEVKMATPDTLAITPQEEIDRMLDAILPVVEACSNPSGTSHHQQPGSASSMRPIVFTSFDPDVCKQLRDKQNKWPVMMLSTGGRYGQHADSRRMSMAAALATASDYRLAGVVVDSGALQQQKAAVSEAASQSLAVMTYGLENTMDVAWVNEQRQLGVLAVIVDDVKRIVAALGQHPAGTSAGKA
eukprot:jgi/Chrzof1/12515/Cz06g37010.t1